MLEPINNFQIEKYCKKNNLPINDIIMRDEKMTDNGFYIINLDDSLGDGTHWTACYKHPLKSYYFDSFGFVSPLEIEQQLKPYHYNNKDIQDLDSKACGYYCIAFIKFLHDKENKEMAFREFLNLFHNKTDKNEDILKKYLSLET